MSVNMCYNVIFFKNHLSYCLEFMIVGKIHSVHEVHAALNRYISCRCIRLSMHKVKTELRNGMK